MEPFVSGPQPRIARQGSRGKQMDIDKADTTAHQRALLDESSRLCIGCDHGRRERVEQAEYLAARIELAAGEFSKHHRMRAHVVRLKPITQMVIAIAEIIDPDRRIDQYHAGSKRRRGGTSSCGSDPPRRASRRALSR